MSYEVRTIQAGHRGCFASQDLLRSQLILCASPLITAPCFCRDRRYPIRCCICWEPVSKDRLCQGCFMEAYCENCLQPPSHAFTCQYLLKLFELNDKFEADIISFCHLCIKLIVSLAHNPTEADSLYDLCVLPLSLLQHQQLNDLNTCIQLTSNILVHCFPINVETLVKDIFQREICNGFCFWDTSYEKYAQAIIPSASYFNHSCYPNAYKINIQGKVYIYALREITQGEEITISYVPHDYDRETRQNVLRTFFGFDCSCLRCISLSSLSLEEQKTLEDFEMTHVHNDCGGIFFYDNTYPSRLVCSICNRTKNV